MGPNNERKTHYALYGKKYYEANKEKINKRSKRNYEKTRELILTKHRHHVLKSRYGITMEEYYKMLEAQNNKCAICGNVATKTLDVDHDHTTEKVRGLLCNNCNRGIGHLKDDPNILRKAIKYLESSANSRDTEEVAECNLSTDSFPPDPDDDDGGLEEVPEC